MHMWVAEGFVMIKQLLIIFLIIFIRGKEQRNCKAIFLKSLSGTSDKIRYYSINETKHEKSMEKELILIL